MMSQATCKFCALADDTIQVICESRCLICSRCQQVPILKKLLIEHTMAIDVSSTATQPARTYLKGFCPVCEASMSTTMLSLISTYKELYKASDDVNSGRPTAGMEMEETSNLISGFLKRYRATYETEVKKNKESTAADPRNMACAADIYDLATQLTQNRAPTNPNSIMEFMVDCYTSMWQNILRNGKDSMLVNVFKNFNRKRFSQRTNDMRARAVLDFLAATTGSESADFLLFGRLIGLQPKQTAQPRPAWGFISTCIIAAGYCDRCIKSGQIYDMMGNPNVAEFRQKVSKMAGPADAKNYPAKSISLRKAIKIIELLCKVKQPYWVMSPIIPQCVEYASKLPWDAPSISKLLNVLIYVSMHEDVRAASASAMPGSAGMHGRGRGSVSLPAINHSVSGVMGGNRGSSVSFSLSPEQSTASIAATAAAFSAASNMGSPPSTSGPRRRASSADISENLTFTSSRIVMLRNLDALIFKLWRSNENKSLSQPQGGKDGRMYFISSLDKHRYSSYIRMDFEQALALAEPQHTVLLSELAYVCINCWDIEFTTIKAMLSRGQTTFTRRPAIVGSYDTSKAKMNGVERLCLIRLLHWYSTEFEFLGVDWDEVEFYAKDRLFPFAIPDTLLEKSHNELNFLAGELVKELREQKEKDAIEDAAIAESGSIAAAHRKLNQVREEVRTAQREEEAGRMYTLEEVEKFNREQYLASHTLGYVDNFLLHSHEMEGVHPNFSRTSTASFDDDEIGFPNHDGHGMSRPHSHGMSRPQSSTMRRSASAEEHSRAFMTDPTQEALGLTEEVDRRRAAAGMPTTADLAESKPGAFSAFSAQVHTAESVEAHMASSRPGDYGARTAGGLARPLTPGHTQTIIRSRPSTAIANANAAASAAATAESDAAHHTKAPAGTPSKHQGKSAAGSPAMGSPAEKNLHGGKFVSRNELTPLEIHVRNMQIQDTSKIITGAGVTGSPIKGRKHVHMDTSLGGHGDFHSHEGSSTAKDDNGSIVSNTSSQVPGKFAVKKNMTFAAPEEPPVDPNEHYKSVRESNKNARLTAAQNRVHERIAHKEMLEATTNTESALSDGMLDPTKLFNNKYAKPMLTRINSQKRRVNLRNLPVLNFNQYVGEYGEVTIDLATHLSAESAVKVFSFKDRNVSLPTFQEIVNHYFKPWHFEHLIRIDIVGINVGSFGARMLSERMSAAMVGLIHLNLSGCQIGGQGVRLVLQGIIDGDGCESLMRLDLRDNNISLASDSFAYIGKFVNLRILDVSKNCFTLDTPAQQKIFREGLMPLRSLETLSVAFNKIMDKGCRQVCAIVRDCLPQLQILDMAGCFLTKACIVSLEHLLEHVTSANQASEHNERRPSLDEHMYYIPEVVVELESTTNPLLREVLLQENMFTQSQLNEYCVEYQGTVLMRSKCKLTVTGSKYIGVAFPLGYNLEDYGIDEYVL